MMRLASGATQSAAVSGLADSVVEMGQNGQQLRMHPPSNRGKPVRVSGKNQNNLMVQSVAPKMKKRAFSTPDEKRSLDKGQLELVTLGGVTFGRLTLQPGWKWSISIKSIVNTESYKARHLHIHVSGRMRIRMDDGTEDEFGPGEVSLLPPGHDAWVVGNEPVVVIDLSGMQLFSLF